MIQLCSYLPLLFLIKLIKYLILKNFSKSKKSKKNFSDIWPENKIYAKNKKNHPVNKNWIKGLKFKKLTYQSLETNEEI